MLLTMKQQEALLTLWLLAMMAVTQSACAAECVQWYTPQEQSFRSVWNYNEHNNWTMFDSECGAAHFGYSLLHRGYVNVTVNVTIQDDDECFMNDVTNLPLRMKRVDNVAYWINGFGISDEVANSAEDLLHMKPGALDSPEKGDGKVDTKTLLWSFATEQDYFNCFKCEMLRRANLSEPVEQDLRFKDTNTRYNVTVTTSGNTSVEEVRLALAAALGVPECSVTVLDDEDLTTTIDPTTNTTPVTSTPSTTPTSPSTTPTSPSTTPTSPSTTPTSPSTTPTSPSTTPTFPSTTPTSPSTTPTSPSTTPTTFLSTTNTSPKPTSPFPSSTPSSDPILSIIPTPITLNDASDSYDQETDAAIDTTTTTAAITSVRSPPTSSTTRLIAKRSAPSIGSQVKRSVSEPLFPVIMYFRVTVPDTNPTLPPEMTSDSFNMTQCVNVGDCPANNMTDGHDNILRWPQTKAGKVVIKRNEATLTLTARECVWRSTDLTATWTDPTNWEESWVTCPPVNTDECPEVTLNNTENLLQGLVDVPVLSRQLGQITAAVNEVLKLDESFLADNNNSTNNIVKYLDNILTNMVLEPGVDVVEMVESDLAIVVSDVIQNGSTVVGVSFDKRGGTNLTIYNTTGGIVNEAEYDVKTVLNESLVLKNTRLAFTIFFDGKAFPSSPTNEDKVNSPVVDVILSNRFDKDLKPDFPDGSFIDIMFRPVEGSPDKACAFWNLTTSNWSTFGCYLLASTDDSSMDTCRCNHLTHFAEIITGGNSNLNELDTKVLEIISLVGCVLSLLAMSAIAMTAICFPRWRREQSNKILLHMTAAIALNIFAFLLVATVDAGQVGCIVIGVLMHYSTLAVFCWMLVLSFLQLIRLLTILGAKGTSYLLLKISLFGWGVPLVFVVILLAIDPNLYSKETGTTQTRTFCYPKEKYLITTVHVPICLALTVNIVVFVVILSRIHSCFGWGQLKSLARHGITDRTVALRRFRTSVVLFFTFGLSWIFGAFAIPANHSVVFDYLFCILASLQGVMLFVCFVVLESKSSGYWQFAVSSALERRERPSNERTHSSKLSSLSLSQHNTSSS